MAETDQGERSEEATPQRREEFRKRGQVAQTKELSAVFLLFSSLLMIWLLGRFFMQEFYDLFQVIIGTGVPTVHSERDWIPFANLAMQKVFCMVGPVAAIMWLIAFASSVVQVGFIYNEEALEFKPERMDPIQGFKKIFSIRSVVEGVKAIIKLTLILLIAYWVLRDQIFVLPKLIHYSISEMFVYLGNLVLKLLSAVGFFMVALAVFDYMFQRWELEKQMRMTKQEIKEEVKSREGDPMIKARIKRVQRDIATKRMMEEVPKADVIVTNPTHIAVALKYDQNMIAPQVVAKGAESVAERIKNLAREHRIPIVENKPLARTIFKTLKIGQAIPKDLYTAVAEVLSYVYRLKKKVVK